MQKLKSDIDIINSVIKGNHSDYKIIIDRYKNKVASVVKSILSDVPEAEDIGQEVFIKLFKNLKNFRKEAKLETYIIRIAINLCYNELKKRERKWSLFSHKTSDQEKANSSIYSSENETDKKELVKLALSKLKHKDRTIINLRLIQQYTSKETAEILEIPIGTVLSRLARAQEKLKTIITQLDQNYEGY